MWRSRVVYFSQCFLRPALTLNNTMVRSHQFGMCCFLSTCLYIFWTLTDPDPRWHRNMCLIGKSLCFTSSPVWHFIAICWPMYKCIQRRLEPIPCMGLQHVPSEWSEAACLSNVGCSSLRKDRQVQKKHRPLAHCQSNSAIVNIKQFQHQHNKPYLYRPADGHHMVIALRPN